MINKSLNSRIQNVPTGGGTRVRIDAWAMGALAVIRSAVDGIAVTFWFLLKESVKANVGSIGWAAIDISISLALESTKSDRNSSTAELLG